MDPRLLRLYNDELAYMREMGSEFSQIFPKIAGRLGLQSGDMADPTVERMMEGFAFLAARVQLKLQARFPDFTQHMLEMVYPHFLAPLPSMAIAQFRPDADAGRMEKGYVIPRGTILLGGLAPGTSTHCQFRTAQDVHLWPIVVSALGYYSVPAQVAALRLPQRPDAKAVLRLRLKTTNGMPFNRLSLKSLVVHLAGSGGLGGALTENLLAHVCGMVVRPPNTLVTWHEFYDQPVVRQHGLDPDQALLPVVPRSFDGYRLLQEYFALPERMLFVEIGGLADAVAQSTTNEIELVFMMRVVDPRLEGSISPSNVGLFATPIVNLFERSADRIHVSDRNSEHHVVIDKLRPMDFELHSLLSVKGQSIGQVHSQAIQYLPFYCLTQKHAGGGDAAYYTTRRERRLPSARQQIHGNRTGYIGSEVFVSLADDTTAVFPDVERQLQLRCLCSNRDLPLMMPIGSAESDFSLEIGAPVETVKCITPPSPPKPSPAEGDIAWNLINHLTLNYLSINDHADGTGAEGLRELLRLYSSTRDMAVARQIEGVRSVSSKPVVKRLRGGGLASLARGIEITLCFDETAFEGVGCFPLAAALSAFFAKYVSINSFTETVLETPQRGTIMRWDMTKGLRPLA
ncbi:type VI secretion system baseplate subunit TssF [Rhizobium sp. ZK1]|uniref:type VI secretion system baseplate subunit TssF n=1 Tax=Rhizobium sp. ZK1 TaxID=3389872 RepID=UPI0039F6DEC3